MTIEKLLAQLQTYPKNTIMYVGNTNGEDTIGVPAIDLSEIDDGVILKGDFSKF